MEGFSFMAYLHYIDSLKLAFCITHAAYSTIESNGPFDVESIIKDLPQWVYIISEEAFLILYKYFFIIYLFITHLFNIYDWLILQ
jgi:hypothetical protein